MERKNNELYNLFISAGANWYNNINELITMLNINSLADLANIDEKQWDQLGDSDVSRSLRYFLENLIEELLKRGYKFKIIPKWLARRKFDRDYTREDRWGRITMREVDSTWHSLIRNMSDKEKNKFYHDIVYGFDIPEAPSAPAVSDSDLWEREIDEYRAVRRDNPRDKYRTYSGKRKSSRKRKHSKKRSKSRLKTIHRRSYTRKDGTRVRATTYKK
jgi:hypothetical protein